MNPAALMLVAGAVVVGTRWASDKKITGKMVMGGLVATFGVAAIAEANERLALLFAALILTGVLLTDGAAFFKGLKLG